MTHHIKQFAQQFLGAVFSHKTITAAAFFALLLTTWIGVQAMRNNDEQDAQNIDADRVLEVDKAAWPKGVIELVEVKNWQSQDFPKGFEITVRNVSAKPIYYCQIDVLFPESAPFLGSPGGLHVFYGNRKLVSLGDVLPTEKDTPIMPGESMTLTPSQGDKDRFFSHLASDVRDQLLDAGIKRLKLVHQVVNFGDGTGYIVDKPFPRTSRISLPVDGIGEVLQAVMVDCSNGAGNCCNCKLKDMVDYCYDDCTSQGYDSGGPDTPCNAWITIPVGCGCTSYSLSGC